MADRLSAGGSARATTSPSAGAIALDGLARAYGSVPAVVDVSLTVAPGEFVTLLGPSGSGKSTTLMMIAGFVPPDRGRIAIGGRDVTALTPDRRNIGVVFQSYALFPHLTVHENVAFPLRVRRVAAAERAARVRQALARLQLTGLEARRPAQLSGGQQQRVALARAIVFEPAVLLMDEPLAASDRKLRQRMQLEIKQLQQTLGVTVLYVTHDQEEALVMSDRIAVMNRGRIEQVDRVQRLYECPATDFVATFLGESNVFAGRVVQVAGNEAEIETGGLLLRAVSDVPRRIGETVHASVRPERVALCLAGDAGRANVAAGVVDAVIFAGDVITYAVRADAGPRIIVKTLNRGGTGAVERGTVVKLAWPVEHTRIIGGGPTS